jgi:CelD/BcsL family acetyltransferase involved in cellulose biosynthesis
MEIKVYQSFDEVRDLWLSFQREAFLYPFQTYEWLSTWFKIAGVKQNIKPYLLVVKAGRDQNEIAMILPLGIEKNGFARRLLWLGGKVTNYLGPVVSKDYPKFRIDITELYAELFKVLPKFDMIYFKKQPEMIGNIPNPMITDESRHYENSYAVGRLFKNPDQG